MIHVQSIAHLGFWISTWLPLWSHQAIKKFSKNHKKKCVSQLPVLLKKNLSKFCESTLFSIQKFHCLDVLELATARCAGKVCKGQLLGKILPRSEFFNLRTKKWRSWKEAIKKMCSITINQILSYGIKYKDLHNDCKCCSYAEILNT